MGKRLEIQLMLVAMFLTFAGTKSVMAGNWGYNGFNFFQMNRPCNECYITFNANGGKGYMHQQHMCEYSWGFNKENRLNCCNFERKGYKFLGWAFDKDAKKPDFCNRDLCQPSDYRFDCHYRHHKHHHDKNRHEFFAVWEKVHTVTVDENGINPVYTGVWTADEVNAYIDTLEQTTTTIGSVDVTNVAEGLNNDSIEATNPNTIIIANEGQVRNPQNVVIDGICANFVVADKQPITIATAFTATKASYKREITSTGTTWGTICLPFAVKSDDNIQYYYLESFNGSTKTVDFEKTSNIEANTPGVFTVTASLDIVEENTEVAVTTSTNDYMIDNLKFAGVQQDTITLASKSDTYYFASNKFKMPTNGSVTINPQRAYFAGNSSSSSSSKAQAISFDDEDFEEAASGIANINKCEAIESTTAIYYDVTGKASSSMQTGLNIVRMSNGKVIKVMK